MSDLEQFSEYWTQDPHSESHVLINIPPLQVHKELLNQGAITAVANLHGWKSTDEIDAMQKCFSLIKGYINEQGLVAMVRDGYKKIDESIAYARANLF